MICLGKVIEALSRAARAEVLAGRARALPLRGEATFGDRRAFYQREGRGAR